MFSESDTDAHHVRLYLAPGGRHHVVQHAVRGNDLTHLLAVDDLHAVIAREVVDDRASLGVERSPQKRLVAHEPGGMEAAHREALRQLIGDERATSDDGASARRGLRNDCLGVVHRLKS